MGSIAASYTIGSPTRLCSASGRTLGTGERYVAALSQSLDTGDFVRQDFADQVWNDGARPVRPLVLLGFWRGVVPEAGAKRRLLIDDESLLDLFEQTGEAGAPDQDGSNDRAALRFVLGLLLLRKRLLVQENSRGTTMLVRVRGTPRPPEGPPLIEIDDPGLSHQQLARVTEQLSAVLSDGVLADAAARGAAGTGGVTP